MSSFLTELIFCFTSGDAKQQSGEAKDALPDDDGNNKKYKSVPVCRCGYDNEKCARCGEGYLEIILQGKNPHFISVEVPHRNAAICHCGEEKSECDVCGKGYVQVVRSGEIPKFKVIYDEAAVKAPQEPAEGQGQSRDVY